MVDFCDQNSSQCLNNGACLVNISSNTSYCHCQPCYAGYLCEKRSWRQETFDTTYTFFIVYLVGLCLSILNNGLVFELFICSKRIRHTNSGIYLLCYSIFSLISSVILAADNIIQYYPNSMYHNKIVYGTFHCYANKIGVTTLNYLCICFSSFIIFEHGLVVGFEDRISASRSRSLVTIVISLLLAIGSAMPMLVYRCEWDKMPALHSLRELYTWFYPVTGITMYILATILLLLACSRRIRRYGTENCSFTKTYFKLLYRYFFIFVPPIAYLTGYLPLQLIHELKNPANSYYQCGITLGEYTIKVLIEAMSGLPILLTWLLFVVPSRVYMNEFYVHTWSGQRLAKTFRVRKSDHNNDEIYALSTMNLTSNRGDTMELSL